MLVPTDTIKFFLASGRPVRPINMEADDKILPKLKVFYVDRIVIDLSIKLLDS